jgi:hypothetical protein
MISHDPLFWSFYQAEAKRQAECWHNDPILHEQYYVARHNCKLYQSCQYNSSTQRSAKYHHAPTPAFQPKPWLPARLHFSQGFLGRSSWDSLAATGSSTLSLAGAHRFGRLGVDLGNGMLHILTPSSTNCSTK